MFEKLFPCIRKMKRKYLISFPDVFVRLQPLFGVMKGFLNMTKSMASQIESNRPKMPSKQLVHKTMKKTIPELELNLAQRIQRPSNGAQSTRSICHISVLKNN